MDTIFRLLIVIRACNVDLELGAADLSRAHSPRDEEDYGVVGDSSASASLSTIPDVRHLMPSK